MKRIYFLALTTLLCFSASAQEIVVLDTAITTSELAVNPWTMKGSTGLNLTQTSFTNWSAGGDNSFSGGTYFNGSADYKKDRWSWSSALVLEYGLSYIESKGNQKTNDRVDFSTQIGYAKSAKWFYSAFADFKSQFYKGYNYPNKDKYISKFLAPAYSNLSAGMEYKPNANFSAYFSPVAGKFTIVQDDYLSAEGAFGVDKGKKFRAQIGTYLKAKAQKVVMENVKVISDINFFTAYDKSFGNVDAEWNILVSMKINKYMNASLTTSLKYDDDVKYIDKDGNTKGSRVQFKEVIAIGMGYNF